MKVFNLMCATGHRFEGWFGSSEDYDRQQAARQLLCPVCESAEVQRLPSAPHLNLSARAADRAPAPSATASAGSGTRAAMPVSALSRTQQPESARATLESRAMASAPTPEMIERLHEAVQKVVREVVARTEDVGEQFAEEARRMHYNEIPERPIRGQVTRDEAEALQDEGIELVPLPMVPVARGRLQ